MKFTYKNIPFGISHIFLLFKDKRKQESSEIMNQYPERIPIICEKYQGSNADTIDKFKHFLVVLKKNIDT